MGRKVHPIVFRLGIVKSSTSRWFAKDQKTFAQNLKEDVMIRKLIKTRLKGAGVALVEIERFSGSINIVIHTSRPGMVIGRSGASVEEMKKDLHKRFFGSKRMTVNLSIQEVKQPDLNAEIVLQGIAEQLEKRVPFRRAMKRGLESSMRAGAQGVKLCVSGRLNGADIARTEKLFEGKVPLHTLRADIDYSRGIAATTYGVIGIKVWIYKGEVFKQQEQQPAAVESPARPVRQRRSPRPKPLPVAAQ